MRYREQRELSRVRSVLGFRGEMLHTRVILDQQHFNDLGRRLEVHDECSLLDAGRRLD